MSWFAHRPARKPPQPTPVTPPHRMKPDDMYAGWHRALAMTGPPHEMLEAARRKRARVNKDEENAKQRLQILALMSKK